MIHRFETFVKSVSTAYKCIQKIKQYEMNTFGLKGGHVMCLFSLGQHPEGLTAGELCTACEIDKSAVSRILPVLYEKGYVYGNKLPGQKYRIKNCLTENGRQVCEAVNTFIAQIVNKAGSGLSAEERKSFYAALDTITQNLSNITDELEGEA